MLLAYELGKLALLSVLKLDLGVPSNPDEGPAPMSGTGWRAEASAWGLSPTSEDLAPSMGGNAT